MTSWYVRGPRPASAALVLLLAAVPRSAPAAEPDASPDKAMCADAYRSAQLERKGGALKHARELLLLCLDDACPSVIKPDCTRWLTEVEEALPSVAFAAKGPAGQDVSEVRVTLDDEVLVDTLDGKSVSLDPGTHALRFELAGHPPIEQSIVVREGEKARVVHVSWAEPAAREHPAEPVARRGPPASAWIFGGVGLAAVTAFGALALHGMQRREALEEECFGRCRPEQVDAIKTQFAVADAALGAGVVSLGIAAALLLSGRSDAPASARTAGRSVSLSVAPRDRGGAVGLTGRF